jgi:rhamnosyltransferase
MDEGMVRELLAVADAFPESDRLAVIGAAFRDVNKESTAPVRDAVSGEWEEAELVITSGSLIPLASHARVGPFREEFFIDYVDMEYCYRARSRGLRVIRTAKPLMSHAIGNYSAHQFLGRKKWTSNHSADRRYYIARNDTVMLREYGNYKFGLWRLKSFARSFRLFKRITFYENEKIKKIAAVWQGWRDGLRGHMGPRSGRGST